MRDGTFLGSQGSGSAGRITPSPPRPAWAERALGAAMARAGEPKRRWCPEAAALGGAWFASFIYLVLNKSSRSATFWPSISVGEHLDLHAGPAEAAGGSGTPLSPALQTHRPWWRPRTRVPPAFTSCRWPKREASLPEDLRSIWAPRDVVSKPTLRAAMPHPHRPSRVGTELSRGPLPLPKASLVQGPSTGPSVRISPVGTSGLLRHALAETPTLDRAPALVL